MNLRKAFAAAVLGLTAVALTTQIPAESACAQTKAEKKAIKLKQLAKKKEVEAPKVVSSPNAKPAPTDIKPPAAPSKPMPTAELARIIDKEIDGRLAAA